MKITKQTALKYESSTGLITNAEETIVAFDTNLPDYLKIIMGRETMPMHVIVVVLQLWGEDDKTLEDIDNYLLDEGEITQDEREIIIEGLYTFRDAATHNKHCNQGEYYGRCKYGEQATCPMVEKFNSRLKAEKNLRNAIEGIRKHIIGHMITPTGVELAIGDGESIRVTNNLGLQSTSWGSSLVTLHRFPNGMNMNEIMKDPLMYRNWYVKNIGD